MDRLNPVRFSGAFILKGTTAQLYQATEAIREKCETYQVPFREDESKREKPKTSAMGAVLGAIKVSAPAKGAAKILTGEDAIRFDFKEVLEKLAKLAQERDSDLPGARAKFNKEAPKLRAELPYNMEDTDDFTIQPSKDKTLDPQKVIDDIALMDVETGEFEKEYDEVPNEGPSRGWGRLDWDPNDDKSDFGGGFKPYQDWDPNSGKKKGKKDDEDDDDLVH